MGRTRGYGARASVSATKLGRVMKELAPAASSLAPPLLPP